MGAIDCNMNSFPFRSSTRRQSEQILSNPPAPAERGHHGSNLPLSTAHEPSNTGQPLRETNDGGRALSLVREVCSSRRRNVHHGASTVPAISTAVAYKLFTKKTEEVSPEELETLYVQVNKFALASHFFWGF
ncbi:ethanolamine kinase 2 [Lates japonicus]|uniref:Ethanolamine kinase 2 n=1 Tax=Lates japonicus TaxID=270547 RepID=A0AAD3MJX4_LATJO|nr:ethanolamine kinase 2 [Lates japonicus]